MAFGSTSIEFDVRRPSVHFSASEYGNRSWSVGFELYFGGWHEKVRINTGEEELGKLDGEVGFAVRDESAPEDEKGQLYYSKGRDDDIFPSPPGYSVSLWLTQQEHDRLIDLIQNGVPLTKLSVSAGQGVEYGWEPDGTGKDWDNTQFPKVPLVGFSLKFGSDEDASSDDDAEPSKSILVEPPRDPFKDNALAKLSEISKQLGWLVLLMVFLAVAGGIALFSR